MFLNKYPHRANFTVPGPGLGAQGYGAGVGRLFADDARWAEAMEPPVEMLWPARTEEGPVRLTEDGIEIVGEDGATLLSGGEFGVSGEASIWTFAVPEGIRFFGGGEKNLGTIELSGRRMRFWSTDVWGDFPVQQWGAGEVDPPYFSTPYLAVETPAGWVGLLLLSPYPAWMETPGTDESRVFVEWQRTPERLILGSDGGRPDLAVIVAPTLAELTRRLQQLVGTTPLPPLWALGYHQSRWGYGGRGDLLALDREFERHGIPCDGLWMDLDYMDGYRIFTISETAFPGGPEATVADLARNGRRIVPIIDPGVKKDPGYAVYDDGRAKGVFCRNVEGGEYVGLVWPGETVFPDFSLSRVGAWWSDLCAKFRARGFGGCWVDMNDPSTGPVDPHGMLFREGTRPHASYRNAYALGMQRATVEGFLAAVPDERPFVLSRSGSAGTSRYAAVWTGDNLSNEFYLKLSIPTSLGMSLSGLPFNGPDVLGFGGDVTDDLALDWMRAGFLFPFLRNHCNRGQRPQAPFEFPPAVMRTLRRYIRLRYKLLPYLYDLFDLQEREGDPVLRPVTYDFPAAAPERWNDQFLVGPWILQAPFLEAAAKTREVELPGDAPWFDAASGRWVEPGVHRVRRSREGTPLYLRAGAVVPMRPGTPQDGRADLLAPQFQVFCPPEGSGETEFRHVADDGLSFGYRRGERSEIVVRAVWLDGHVLVTTETAAEGFGSFAPTFVIHGAPRSVRLNGAAPESREDRVVLAGGPLRVTVVG